MTIAGVISLAALATVIASLGYLHVAPTGLSPIRNPVSQYGITEQRRLPRRNDRRRDRRGRRSPSASLSCVLGALMAASLAGLVLSRSRPALRARFGLIERGFYASAIAWFAVFSIACAAKLS